MGDSNLFEDETTEDLQTIRATSGILKVTTRVPLYNEITAKSKALRKAKLVYKSAISLGSKICRLKKLIERGTELNNNFLFC